MSKYLRFLLLSLLAFGLLSVPVFASTVTVTESATGAVAAFNAALEAMGAARNVTLTGAAYNAGGSGGVGTGIAYSLNVGLATSDFVQISLGGGAAFNGELYYLCAGNVGNNTTNTVLGSSLATQNATTLLINTTGTTNSAADYAGNTLWITGANDPTCSGANSDFDFELQPETTTGTGTITISTLSSSLALIDGPATKTLVQYNKEYAPVIGTATTITIDYLGTPGNGSRFIESAVASNEGAGTNWALSIVPTPQNLDATNLAITGSMPAAAANAGLTVKATIGLTDSASWSGVSTVALTANNGPASANAADPGCSANSAGANVYAVNAPTGTITATSVAGWAGHNSLAVDVCVYVTGTTVLSTRTITETYTMNISGVGAYNVAYTGEGSPGSTIQTWINNGYQAILPWIGEYGLVTDGNTTPVTYCLVNNASANNGTMYFSVLASDSNVAVAQASLGTIPATTSLMLVFDANGVEEYNANQTTLTTLLGLPTLTTTYKRYVGQLSVAVPQNSVSVVCQQTDPTTHGRRQMPVLVNTNGFNTTNYKWIE